MQLSNCTVRLGGSLTNTVPKLGVTPAEIVVLRHIHGNDAVVDIRPTGKVSRASHSQEYDRLSQRYDRGAGAFVGAPGDAENRGVLERLFPGAIKKLPVTLEEIGIGAPASEPEPEVAPETEPDEEVPIGEPEVETDNEDEMGEAPEGGENAAGAEGA